MMTIVTNAGPKTQMMFLAGALLLVAALAVVLLSAGDAEAKTITLTSDTNGKQGLVEQALKDSSDGDVIVLQEGLFYEGNLTVSKEVVVSGDADSLLAVDSVRITAENVTFMKINMVLDAGVITVEADNWTFDWAVVEDCMSYTCIRVEATTGGIIKNSTFIGTSADAIEINRSSDIMMDSVYVLSPHVGIKLNRSVGLVMTNVRVAQSDIGMYTSWCDDVLLERAVFDTKGWGILAANTTNLTVKDSLLLSSSTYLTNYGIYLAFCQNTTVENNTFTADAAGVSLWKSVGAVVRWNSIFGNLEGIWSWESELTAVDNAIFNNLAFGLNATGHSPTATNNYWGTTSVSEAKALIRGAVVIEPIRTADPTPDARPVQLNPIPNISNGTEDASAVMLLELGPYFSDDTWYVAAYMPPPSKVRFVVVHNSDAKNVTLRVSEKGTCSGTCKDVEGELRATTSANWYGTVSVRIKATDWRGKSIETNTFTMTFIPVNDRPVLSIEHLPKNSDVGLRRDETRDLNISVFDDSASVLIEYKVDNGSWMPISTGSACSNDASVKEKYLPRCVRYVHKLEVPDDLTVGKHTLAFRACDGQYCSDETYTGKYEIELENRGRTGRDFSPTGAGLAGVLMLLIAIVAASMAGKGRERSDGGAAAEKVERPVRAKDEEE